MRRHTVMKNGNCAEGIKRFNFLDYYSAVRRKEILPFAATWMELEGIMLSEISQTETNTAWYHSFM